MTIKAAIITIHRQKSHTERLNQQRDNLIPGQPSLHPWDNRKKQYQHGNVHLRSASKQSPPFLAVISIHSIKQLIRAALATRSRLQTSFEHDISLFFQDHFNSSCLRRLEAWSKSRRASERQTDRAASRWPSSESPGGFSDQIARHCFVSQASEEYSSWLMQHSAERRATCMGRATSTPAEVFSWPVWRHAFLQCSEQQHPPKALFGVGLYLKWWHATGTAEGWSLRGQRNIALQN